MRSICTFLGSFLIHFASIHTEIVEVSDLDYFKIKIAEFNPETLVIFDVDQTLITPKESIFRAKKEQLTIDYQMLARKIFLVPNYVWKCLV